MSEISYPDNIVHKLYIHDFIVHTFNYPYACISHNKTYILSPKKNSIKNLPVHSVLRSGSDNLSLISASTLKLTILKWLPSFLSFELLVKPFKRVITL